MLRDFALGSCVLLERVCCACCAGYQHPVDVVVSDLVSCLEDCTLPLMQFSEAFAVVQVGKGPIEEAHFLVCKHSISGISVYSISGIRTLKHPCKLPHTSPCMHQRLHVQHCEPSHPVQHTPKVVKSLKMSPAAAILSLVLHHIISAHAVIVMHRKWSSD